MRRSLALGLLVSSGLVLPACGKKQPSAIVVAVSAEGAIPADVDQLELVVSRSGSDGFQNVYVLPQDAPLPGTLTVYDDHDDPGEPILVSVRGRLSSQGPEVWRVVRRARLGFAKEKTKLLRMPLRFSCYDVPCTGDLSCVAGECVSPVVDVETLPEFTLDTPVAVATPAAGTPASGFSCFVEGACLADAKLVADFDQASCGFAPAFAAGAYNLAMKWKKSATPDHLVVLEPGSPEGYSVNGKTATLVKGLCNALKNQTAELWVSGACATKKTDAPVCVPTSGGIAGKGGAGGAAGAGGAGGAGSAGAGGAGMAGAGGAGMAGAGGAGMAGAGGAGMAGAGGAGMAGAGGAGMAGAGGAGMAGAGGAGMAGAGGAGMAGAGGAGMAGAAGAGGSPLPFLEVCNGLDDDGNGMVDDGNPCANQFPDAANVASWTCASLSCVPACSGSAVDTDKQAFNGCEGTAPSFAQGAETTTLVVTRDDGNDVLLSFQTVVPGNQMTKVFRQLSPRQWKSVGLASQDGALHAVLVGIDSAPSKPVWASIAGDDLLATKLVTVVDEKDADPVGAPGLTLGSGNQVTLAYLSDASRPQFRRFSAGTWLLETTDLDPSVPSAMIAPVAPVYLFTTVFGSPTGRAAFLKTDGSLYAAVSPGGNPLMFGAPPPITLATKPSPSFLLAPDGLSKEPSLFYVDAGKVCEVEPMGVTGWGSPVCVPGSAATSALSAASNATQQANVVAWLEGTKLKASIGNASLPYGDPVLVDDVAGISSPLVVSAYANDANNLAYVIYVAGGELKLARITGAGALAEAPFVLAKVPSARTITGATFQHP